MTDDLTGEKEKTTATIESLMYSTAEEKADYEGQITDTTTADAIDAMKYLTGEEKSDYKQQVADATTTDVIDVVVSVATAKKLGERKGLGDNRN
nr:hypothetical protein [Weissella cibaria]